MAIYGHIVVRRMFKKSACKKDRLIPVQELLGYGHHCPYQLVPAFKPS